jgi:hypothetical protein
MSDGEINIYILEPGEKIRSSTLDKEHDTIKIGEVK